MVSSTRALHTPDRPRVDSQPPRRGLLGQRHDALWPATVPGRGRSARMARAAALLLLTVIAVALLAPVLAPAGGAEVDFTRANLAPTPAHPFGTDDLGRDLLYRVLVGGRVTLTAGLLAAIVAVLAGTAIGAISGYGGGRTDSILMRVTDVALSLPTFFVVLFLGAVMKPGADETLSHPARAAIAVVTLALGGLLGSLGIVSLVAKGYSALSWGFALVYIIPVCTLGVAKIVKSSRV